MNKIVSLAGATFVSLALVGSALAAPTNGDYRYLNSVNSDVTGMERVFGHNGDVYRALLRADGFDRSDIAAVYLDDNGIFWVKLDPGASPNTEDNEDHGPVA